MLGKPSELQAAPHHVDLTPVFRRDEAHGLRSAEIRYAGYEVCGLDLPSEQEASRVIRFGNTVHREAPRYSRQLRRKIADRRSGVGEMVVQPRDSPFAKFSAQQHGLDKMS